MSIKLAGIIALSLVMIMVVPAYADVDIVKIEKEQFSLDDKFTISGTVSDADRVMLTAVMKGPNNETLIKNQRTDPDGTYSFIPIQADLLLKSKGDYTITVFTELQPFNEGQVVKLRYENNVVIVLPDYTLELKEIGNKVIDEAAELSFTASVTDSTIEELEYILEKRPDGATINKDTGEFSWTPTYLQSGGYIIDVIVKSGPLEDKKSITVTVNDKVKPVSVPTPDTTKPKEKEPEPKETTTPKELGLASFVDETKDPQSYVDRYNSDVRYKEWFDVNYSEYSSIYQAVGLEKPLVIPASFVDETKDPQSYVDRYNSDVRYKEWFDVNYSEYSSIYQAVGLEEPKEIASFVDANIDPQYYVDRYNDEAKYKKWFDETYPDMTIYQAVGLEEPKEKEKQFGTCGEGTRLIDGICEIFDESEFGECGEGTELINEKCSIIGKTIEKPWWQFW